MKIVNLKLINCEDGEIVPLTEYFPNKISENSGDDGVVEMLQVNLHFLAEIVGRMLTKHVIETGASAKDLEEIIFGEQIGCIESISIDEV